MDRAALAAAYEQGASLQACGRRFGISPPTVARLLREQGVTIRPPYSYRARADVVALAAAYAAGRTLAECGQQHGISAPTAARILREHGVTLRPAHRRPATRAGLAHSRRHPHRRALLRTPATAATPPGSVP